MGLKVTKLRDQKKEKTVRADRRLWLTKDRQRVVEDGDPEAAFLLAAKGREIPEAEARRLGLLKGSEPAEDKSLTPENKAPRKRKKKA